LVGLHDQSLAVAAEELVAEIPAKAIANDATTAAALRLVMSLDTMVPLFESIRDEMIHPCEQELYRQRPI
jgi:hypothetical protein